MPRHLPGAHLPGGLGRLRVERGQLHLEVLDDHGHHLAATIAVDAAQRHALHHLHATQTRPACAVGEHRPVVDALLASLEALDARATALVVAPGPPVTFHLAVRGPFGAREVPLTVVDAAALIFSRRVPLRVAAPAIDWDGALARLT